MRPNRCEPGFFRWQHFIYHQWGQKSERRGRIGFPAKCVRKQKKLPKSWCQKTRFTGHFSGTVLTESEGTIPLFTAKMNKSLVGCWSQKNDGDRPLFGHPQKLFQLRPPQRCGFFRVCSRPQCLEMAITPSDASYKKRTMLVREGPKRQRIVGKVHASVKQICTIDLLKFRPPPQNLRRDGRIFLCMDKTFPNFWRRTMAGCPTAAARSASSRTRPAPATAPLCDNLAGARLAKSRRVGRAPGTF